MTAGVNDCCLNSGQTCSALTRMLVPRARYDEAVAIAKAAAERFTVGDPTSEATKLGPLVSATQRDRVRGYIRKGGDSDIAYRRARQRRTFRARPRHTADIGDAGAARRRRPAAATDRLVRRPPSVSGRRLPVHRALADDRRRAHLPSPRAVHRRGVAFRARQSAVKRSAVVRGTALQLDAPRGTTRLIEMKNPSFFGIDNARLSKQNGAEPITIGVRRRLGNESHVG